MRRRQRKCWGVCWETGGFHWIGRRVSEVGPEISIGLGNDWGSATNNRTGDEDKWRRHGRGPIIRLVPPVSYPFLHSSFVWLLFFLCCCCCCCCCCWCCCRLCVDSIRSHQTGRRWQPFRSGYLRINLIGFFLDVISHGSYIRSPTISHLAYINFD